MLCPEVGERAEGPAWPVVMLSCANAEWLGIVFRALVRVTHSIGAALNAHYGDLAVARGLMTPAGPSSGSTSQDLRSWPDGLPVRPKITLVPSA